MSNVLAVDHQLAPHNGDRASSDPGQEVSGSAGNRPLEQHDSGSSEAFIDSLQS